MIVPMPSPAALRNRSATGASLGGFVSNGAGGPEVNGTRPLPTELPSDALSPDGNRITRLSRPYRWSGHRRGSRNCR